MALISRQDVIEVAKEELDSGTFFDIPDKLEKISSVNLFNEHERDRISGIFQNYFCMGIDEIAEEDETSKSIFEKVGIL